jgi:pre-60S factor REI1
VEDDDEKKPIYSCKLCKKQFHSVHTLQSHVKSTEHLMRKEQRIIERDSTAGSALSSTSLGSAALGLHRRNRAHARARLRETAPETIGANLADVDAEEQAARGGTRVKPAAEPGTVSKPKVSFEDRESDVTETRCLFCGLPSKTMRANLKHMLQVHEFTIPLVDRCKDLRQLLQYLARKVNGLMCLVCGERTKKYDSLEAVRAHMAAQNHERLVLTSEYADFYEGAIDDGEQAVVKTVEDGSAALVVRKDKARRVLKRNATQFGLVRRLTETPMQREQRHLITAAGMAETQLLLKERRRETQKERTKHFKNMNVLYRHQKKVMMRVGTKKLWNKGFDGDDLFD